MFQDLRHAARMLLHAKGWTAVVLVSLALGIGANTALFTAVNGLLIRQLPVPHPETLVRLRWAGQNQVQRSSSDYGFNAQDRRRARTSARPSRIALYQAMRAAGQSSGALTDLAASAPMGSVNILLNGSADLSSTLLVSGNYFQVMQVSPFLGRLISPEDDQPSAPAVAVISYAVWTRRFGSDPNVVGRVVNMNNVPVTIVGVTPESFTGTQTLGDSGRDITLPLSLDPQFGGDKRLNEPTYWWLQIDGPAEAGRDARAGAGEPRARCSRTPREDGWTRTYASLTPEQRMLARNQNRTAVPHLEVDSGQRGHLRPRHRHDALGALRSASSSSLVLLIVCANVANLLLSRATTRQKEIVGAPVAGRDARAARPAAADRKPAARGARRRCSALLVGYWGQQLLPFGAGRRPIDWRVLGFVAGAHRAHRRRLRHAARRCARRAWTSASSLKETSRSVAARGRSG